MYKALSQVIPINIAKVRWFFIFLFYFLFQRLMEQLKIYYEKILINFIELYRLILTCKNI